MFISLPCMFIGASLRQWHGEAVLHQRHKRPGWRGVIVSGLRSGTTELPAGRLLLRPLPRWILHRQRHQPVPGVSAQHTPGRTTHLRPGRLCRLWAWKHQQQGRGLQLGTINVKTIPFYIHYFEKIFYSTKLLFSSNKRIQFQILNVVSTQAAVQEEKCLKLAMFWSKSAIWTIWFKHK